MAAHGRRCHAHLPPVFALLLLQEVALDGPLVHPRQRGFWGLMAVGEKRVALVADIMHTCRPCLFLSATALSLSLSPSLANIHTRGGAVCVCVCEREKEREKERERDTEREREKEKERGVGVGLQGPMAGPGSGGLPKETRTGAVDRSGRG